MTSVYTAIMGSYDFLIPNWTDCRQHVCFTDRPTQSLGWDVRIVDRRFKDPRLEARMYKALPHLFLPDGISIWHDGTIGLKVLPQEVTGFLDGHDIAVFRHPWHNTLTEEAEAVIRTGRAERTAVNEQLAMYLDDGYPDDHPLYSTGVMVRRHSAKVVELGSAWWAEMSWHTPRDQLSFSYLCWKLKIECGIIPGHLWPGLSPDMFLRCKHREPKFHTGWRTL